MTSSLMLSHYILPVITIKNSCLWRHFEYLPNIMLYIAILDNMIDIIEQSWKHLNFIVIASILDIPDIISVKLGQ